MSENMSFKKKIENFWYHYKWQTIIGGFVAVVLVIAAIQLLTKVNPDASVIYAGPHELTNEDRKLAAEAFSSILKEDLNGDGKKVIDLTDIMMYPADVELTPAQAQEQNVNRRILDQEIAAGTTYILILHKSLYEDMLKKGVLSKLADILGSKPDFAASDYGIELDKLPAYEVSKITYLRQDYILCFSANKTGPKAIREDSVKYFKDLVSHK